MSTAETAIAPVDYRTDPSQYKHWKLSFNGPVATLGIDIAEDGGIRDGYKLKLNSYDLGVDIELHDAIQRIRFEHPEVKTVVLTSLKTSSARWSRAFAVNGRKHGVSWMKS